MKKLLIGAVVFALLLGTAGMAQAASWDDLTWWGNSGATPKPMKSASGSGYWWWPTAPAESGDADLWGNRGVVYGMYSPPSAPSPKAVDPPKPPPPPPSPKVTRSTPVFNNVLFDFDKSTLKAEGQAEISKVAGQMDKNSSDTLTIVGHTDNVNHSGDPNYNVNLGQRRADSVRDALIADGVAASRVSTASRGDSEPAVNNDTAANRALNRRVVFQYGISD